MTNNGDFNRGVRRILSAERDFREFYRSFITSTKINGVIYVATEKQMDRKEFILRQYYQFNDDNIMKLKTDVVCNMYGVDNGFYGLR